MRTAQLPFERGRTAGNFGLPGVTLSDTSWNEILGNPYWVPDTVHGTGQCVVLIPVKNDTGDVITVARQFIKFSTGALDFFCKCAGYNDSAGGIVLALDDAYTVGVEIPDDDIFYAVLQGPVSVNTGAVGVNLAVHDVITSDATACIQATAAAAGQFPAATIDQATTDEDTAVVIHMAGNRSMPPAA